LERQIAQQQETTDRLRRSELADKLFRSECFPNFKTNTCPDPRHVVADISAALEEYIQAERRRLKISFNPNWRAEEVSPCAGISFDLNGRVSDRLVNLRKLKLAMNSGKDAEVLGLSLPGKDLSCIDFSGSVLENADMTSADLSGSRLHYSKLQGAQLNQTNLLDTTGLPLASLTNTGLESVSNVYCNFQDFLATTLTSRFSIKGECQDADDSLISAY
jgi:metal-sulfur cluster biosynthetic enzyme